MWFTGFLHVSRDFMGISEYPWGWASGSLGVSVALTNQNWIRYYQQFDGDVMGDVMGYVINRMISEQNLQDSFVLTSQYLGFNWISRGNLLGLGVFYFQSRTPGGVDHFFFQYCSKEMWFFWDERKSLRHHIWIYLGERTSWNHTALVFWMRVFVNTKMGLNQETQGYYWYDP